ncbi:MAG: GIY-YIG nuclease family protein [bacterium]
MIEKRNYFVYINTNKTHNVFYTGVSNNLLNRNSQHKNKDNKLSFTAKYNVNKLVWYEIFSNIYDAISREKQIKGGSRKKKIFLVNKLNPMWKDLALDW